ncbi:Hypothetical protein D9617_3g019780 [Elsinoe fawcettii]|nr:Hypothetical protein D9617_3g019780 [Elsinoe fawcettii]
MDETHFLQINRYLFLFATWAAVTGAAFYRVSRQPYITRIKTEQYETIFKGTTLLAALVGIGMSGRLGKRRHEP